MTQDQAQKHGNLGSKGNDLQTAIEAYAAKEAAKVAADAAFNQAKAALDAAVTAFGTADTAFVGSFTYPSGYTPPTP